jgi:hypothetical protein
MNRNFAKLNDGIIEWSPNPMLIDNMIVGNPSDEQYLAAGYKPVITSTPPTPPEGYFMQPSWEEREDGIYQVWTEAELPPKPFDAGSYMLETFGI